VICSSCGNENANNARFCNSCGGTLADPPDDAELLGAAFAEGHYDEASRLFADLVESDTFVEFLTLPAYERID